MEIMTINLTIGDFKRKISRLYKKKYIVLSEVYHNESTEMTIHCDKCNFTFRKLAHKLNNVKVKHCRCLKEKPLRKKPIYNFEYFKQQLESKYGDEYIIIGKFEDYSKPIKIKHNKEGCGRVFEKKPARVVNYLIRTPCFPCSKKRRGNLINMQLR